MLNLSERETIEKAAAGDEQAFRKLVESTQGFVFSIAYRFTGDEAEAEDLVQESFIRLWKNLRRYNPEYKLKTWLGKIVTNLSLDYLKSVSARNMKNRKPIEEDLPIMDRSNPERELEGNELNALVMKLAAKLTPKQQAAFILRDLEMLEANEVCEMLGITAGNLKSNLYYARISIKESLIKYYKLPMI